MRFEKHRGSAAVEPWKRYVRNAVVGGRRMGYLDVGGGPAILLVHGLGASWRVWSNNLAALTAEHRVIVVDLPGFGESQNLSSPVDIDDYAAALAGLLDILGVDEAVVVGHSLGGLICQRLAVRHRGRVSGVILVSTTGGVMSAGTRTLFRVVAAGTAPLALLPKGLVAPAMRNAMAVPAVRRWLLKRMVHDPDRISPDLAVDMLSSALSSTGTAAAIRAGLRVLPENDLGVINCPVLVLSGDQDRITPVAAAADLARRLPRAKRITWPGVGHHPMWEEPTDFDSVVLGFLRELKLSA
jgi:pimeloyl-ACP methyl ester carboxylesterase